MYRSGNSKPTLEDLQFEESLKEYNVVKQKLLVKLLIKYGEEKVAEWLQK